MSFHQTVQQATEAAIARLGDDLAGHVRRISQQIVAALEAERATLTEEIRRDVETDAERRIAESTRRAREEAAEEFAAGLAATGVRLVATDGGVDQSVAARFVAQPALRSVRDAARLVMEAGTLGQTLDALADGAAGEVSRSAVFLVEQHALRPWRLTGFDAEAAATPLPVSDQHPLAELFAARVAVTLGARAGDDDALPFVTPPAAAQGIAVPMTVGGDVIGVLYGDAGVEDAASRPGWREALELLAACASQRLENLTLRRAGQIDVRPWVSRVDPDAGPADPRLDEARQLAHRLLAAVVLDHGDAVAAGRSRRDLLSRLDHEIREARTRYHAHVDEGLAERDTIFEDELLRTLAAGDGDALGRYAPEPTPEVGSST